MVLLSVETNQGKRSYMEDRCVYYNKNGIIIALVCDGHGCETVAEYTHKSLPEMIYIKIYNINASNYQHALILQQVVLEWGEMVETNKCGSTLTGIVIKHNTLFTINIGDSKTCFRLKNVTNIYNLNMFNNGILSNKPRVNVIETKFFCTKDHNSAEPSEINRVINHGGKILGDRLNGILSVTRALGDYDVGPGLTYMPDIYWVNTSELDGPIVMYSDGINEPKHFNKEQFDDYFLYQVGEKYGAKKLIEHAYNGGSEDNLTAMIVSV